MYNPNPNRIEKKYGQIDGPSWFHDAVSEFETLVENEELETDCADGQIEILLTLMEKHQETWIMDHRRDKVPNDIDIEADCFEMFKSIRTELCGYGTFGNKVRKFN